MDPDNIVRTLEVLCTALALTLAVGILAPAQDASARHTPPHLHQIDQHPSIIDQYAVDL